MKKLIGLIALVCRSASMMMSQQYHYYYGNAQIPLTLNTEKAYLLLDGISSAEALESLFTDIQVVGFDSHHPTATFDLVQGGAEDHERVWAQVQFLEALNVA